MPPDRADFGFCGAQKLLDKASGGRLFYLQPGFTLRGAARGDLRLAGGAKQGYGAPAAQHPSPKGDAMAKPDVAEDAFVLSDHAAGAIAYLTFVPAILFLVLEPYKKSSYVRFHSWQSILLFVGAFGVNLVLAFLLVFALLFTPWLHVAAWRAIELFWLAVWIACVVNAALGKRFKLPVIGELAEQQVDK
jgi:uncharacterized membrane protein